MSTEGVVIGGAIFVVLVLLLRLYVIVHRLNTSFAKLGYVVREDAKKYFDEAADKIVDTNEQFQSQYTKIIHDGTASALSEAGTALEATLSKAQGEAGQIIIQARQEAQNIIVSARKEANKNANQTLGQTTDTVRWVMEQYISTQYTVNQQEDIINTLLDEYINEHRS